jgi:copper chaperone
MARQTYSVPGISCDNCKNAIEQSVGSVPGVTRVDANVQTKVVLVEGEASDQSIRAAIDEVGYDVAEAGG